MSGNATQPPMELPENMNLLSEGVRIASLVLMAISISLALFLIAWVLWNRPSPVVKMMQPIFLILLCVGGIITNFSIIPMGANDENTGNIDAACLGSQWLVYVGSTITLSALFSKLWRINQIFHAEGFHRKVVTVKDVLRPFSILLILNLTFLVIMSVVDPPVWKREPVNESNPNNTVGYCSADGAVGVLMGVLLALVNFIALIILCVQAYRARDINSDFSEARGVALGLFSSLQAIIITVPTNALSTEDNTDAKYMLSVMEELVPTLSMLLFIFGPIMQHQRRYARQGSTTANITTSQHINTRTHISGIGGGGDHRMIGSVVGAAAAQNHPISGLDHDENHATVSELEMELQTLRTRIVELEGGKE